MTLATLCYIQKDGKTLMLHRNKVDGDMHQGFYVAPGGQFDPGESPEECVCREIKEESGLKLNNATLKGILTFSNKGRDFGEQTQPDWYVFVYTAKDFEGKLKSPKEGDLEWIADEEVHKLPMWEGDKVFTAWVYQEGIFSGKLKYEGKKLVDHSVVFY